jgi:hypothetical protein
VLSILCLGEVVFAMWTVLDVKYFHFHFHTFTLLVSCIFNGKFKREVRMRLAGILMCKSAKARSR